MVRFGVLQALGDEQAEQILGAEIGRVQRIDVGAQARAERGGEVAAVRRSRRSGARMRLQRRGAARSIAGLVEIGGIIIGDAALVGAGAPDWRGRRRR